MVLGSIWESVTLICMDYAECVPLTTSYHLYFLSKVRSYIKRQWRDFTVKNIQILFLFFNKKNCVFIIFIFFYEVSNFRNRILTNPKPELVIRSFFQWNCMYNTSVLLRSLWSWQHELFNRSAGFYFTIVSKLLWIFQISSKKTPALKFLFIKVHDILQIFKR